MKTLCITLTAALLLQPFAFGDVSYQETTRITGGSMQGMLKMAGAFSSQAKQANAPTTTNIELHGNRMVRSNPHITEIIDLDQQAITSIDHDKHTYSIMTFEQMRQAFAKASEKGKRPAATSDNGQSQISFNAHISSNSTTRQIDGREAKESLLTLTMLSNNNDGSNTKAGMAATSEMWLVSEVPGMAELRSFNKKMAQEMALDLSGGPMSGLLAAQPGGAEAMANLKKESAKMSGFPVLQVTRVGMSTDGQPLPAPSVAPLAEHKSNSGGETATRDVTTDAATQAANQESSKLGGIGRMLGSSSLGGLMHHKASNDSKTDTTQAQNDNSAAAGVLLESQTETYNFSSSPVDAGIFQIPAGYKQITSPMARQ
jgi:hypothetical protein